ncbi:MAG TPA: response regulator [Thiothrix sp.]|nr:response regulator [Thiothrix sp.]
MIILKTPHQTPRQQTRTKQEKSMKPNSLGISFFGLTNKELAVFQRVIQFFEKKGKLFHECQTDTASAAIFIIKNQPDAVEQAKLVHTQQVLLTLVNNNNETPAMGKHVIQQPLLVTRVMRAIDEASKLVQSSHKTPISTSSPTPTAINESTFHALVVDDSAAIRKQLELELRETTMTADYAVCGEDALEKINSQQYDLVFLDIVMPGIDGYEVCKQLRKMPNYKRTPVIMLSGKTGPLDEVEGILAGASTYMLKPVKHKDFQETLERISKWLAHFS